MSRFVSNLKLLHKLAIPAVVFLAAGLATIVMTFHLMAVFEDNVATIVDRHGVRLERTPVVAPHPTEATPTQRDPRPPPQGDRPPKSSGEAPPHNTALAS